MSKLIWKPGNLIAPVPAAMVSCGTMEKPNIITIAWTGNVSSSPAKVSISVRPERYSYGLIKESGEFVLNLTTAALVRAADFCGVRSGREVDKFAQLGLTPLPAREVACPLVGESPVNLECRVCDVIPLGSHDGPVPSGGLRPRGILRPGQKGGELWLFGAQKAQKAPSQTEIEHKPEGNHPKLTKNPSNGAKYPAKSPFPQLTIAANAL